MTISGPKKPISESEEKPRFEPSKDPSYIPPDVIKDVPIGLKEETAYWTTGKGQMLTEESSLALIEAEHIRDDLMLSGRLQEMGIDPYLEGHNYVKGHCVRVAVLCLLMNQNLPPHAKADDKRLMTIAAMLHDIGKLHPEIHKVIMSKKKYPKGHPSAEKEWKIIRKHPIISAEIALHLLGNITGEERVKIAHIIDQHHERVDGSGYRHKKGREICKEARIMGPADVADAAGEQRPYKGILPPKSVMKLLENEKQKYDTEAFASLKNLYGRSGIFFKHRNSDRP